MVHLLPQEKVIYRLSRVKVLYWKWMTGTFYWYKKVLVTNKRIIISFQWFGREKFSPALSYYYKPKIYRLGGRQFTYGRLFEYHAGKGRFWGDYLRLKVGGQFFGMNIKIWTKKAFEIEKIIKKNS